VSGSQDHLFLNPAKAFTDLHESAEIKIFPKSSRIRCAKIRMDQ